MKFFQVVQYHGIHIAKLLHDLLHRQKYLIDCIAGTSFAERTIFLHAVDFIFNYRIHQFILIGKKLVDRFLRYPQLAAISSIDTERIPYRINNSSALTCIRSRVSITSSKIEGQNYGNFFRCQSFHHYFFTICNNYFIFRHLKAAW